MKIKTKILTHINVQTGKHDASELTTVCLKITSKAEAGDTHTQNNALHDLIYQLIRKFTRQHVFPSFMKFIEYFECTCCVS